MQRSGVETIKYHTDPGYQWESYKLTIRHHKREQRGQPFLTILSHIQKLYTTIQTYAYIKYQYIYLTVCIVNYKREFIVPRSTSYVVYISQLIRFARASSYVADFNIRNKLLTQKLLKQGYRYHRLRKIFSKFYRRYYDLISKFQIGLKSLLRQGLSEPDFYGDLVYKLKKIVGSNNFSAQFIKIISHYKKDWL